VADLRLRGEHRFWVNQFRGVVEGTLGGSFALDSPTGEVELTDGRVNLLLRSLTIAGVPDPTGDARLDGRVEVPRTALANLTDPASMRRIEVDAEVDIPVHNLAFIELLAGDLGALELTGRGRLTGRIVNRDEQLRRGTAFSVDAAELALSWPPYRFSGDGEVGLRLDAGQTEPDQVVLGVNFAQVVGTLVRMPPAAGDDSAAAELPLFRGRGLEAGLRLPLVSEGSAPAEIPIPQIQVSIPEVSVPDLSVYDALLPAQWGLALRGGDGSLSLRAALDAQALQIALELRSSGAAVGIADYLGRGDLALEFKARAERGAAATLDLAGSQLRLSEVRIDRGTGAKAPAEEAGAASAASWADAGVVVETARLSVPVPDVAVADTSLAALAQALAADGLNPVLSKADGEVAATLTVSRLDWIAVLLGQPLGFELYGSGLVAADLVLKDGWPAKGTRLRISPEDLRVGILDHVIEGQGGAVLNLVEGGERPRASLLLDIENGRMRRDDTQTATVDEVSMALEVTAPVADQAAAKEATVGLTIKSAHIKDVGVFNAYLPAGSPIVIDSGEAGLAGYLSMTAESASGELVLEAREIGLTAVKNALWADALLTLNVRGGTPAAMRFDVGGSALRLENVRVQGETRSHDEAGWSARLQLDDTDLVWEKPMRLDLTAGVTLEDTRPFVAILDNMRGKHDWISKLLEAQGLTGQLSLVLDEQSATIRDSRVLTEQVGIRLKGRSDESGREAMLFVRYGQLAGALSQRDEQRRFSIIKARDQFDAYSPGETPLETEGIDEQADSAIQETSAAATGDAAAAPEETSAGPSAEASDAPVQDEQEAKSSQPAPSAFLDTD
jgi:hypothetical protein